MERGRPNNKRVAQSEYPGTGPPITVETDCCRITLNRRGADEYTKISYPLKYGIYSEIETQDAVLQFNLNHEIIRIKGKSAVPELYQHRL